MTFSNRTLRGLLASATIVAALATPAISNASTTTGTVPVSATVVNNCVIGTNSMAFGNYDAVSANASTNLTANGTLALTCTKSDAVTISADAGGNATHATGTTRAMTATINATAYYLNYELYTDSGATTVWNTTNKVAYTGTGTSGTATFYGVVPKAQNTLPAGSFSDTVNITVTF